MAEEKVEEKKGGRKILFLIPILLLLLAVAGGGVYFFLLNKPKKEGEEKISPSHVGVMVDLGVFTVNLADKGTDAYARVAITLELSNEKVKREGVRNIYFTEFVVQTS